MLLSWDIRLKKIEKPGKLHQEKMGYLKKNKLEIDTLNILIVLLSPICLHW